MPSESVEPLACPTCARRFTLAERFCPDCEMPLVYVGRGEEEPITAAHEKARKVNPQYTSGELVKAAFARNQAEAELIQGILLEEGIPSVERRTRGFDVPDFLAAGPRDILVPASAHDLARQLLAGPGDSPVESSTATPTSASRLFIGLALALALAVLCVWALWRLAS
jgi:hypothetical protein